MTLVKQWKGWRMSCDVGKVRGKGWRMSCGVDEMMESTRATTVESIIEHSGTIIQVINNISNWNKLN